MKSRYIRDIGQVLDSMTLYYTSYAVKICSTSATAKVVSYNVIILNEKNFKLCTIFDECFETNVSRVIKYFQRLYGV